MINSLISKKITSTLSKFINWLTLLLIGFALLRLIPQAWNNYQSQGIKLASRESNVISSTEEMRSILFPPANKRKVAIFWASWCGPCKIEMQRLQKSIENKKIKATDIIAINPFESSDEIDSFLKSNRYTFIFIDNPEITSSLSINVTPTTLLIDNQKIISRSSGLSISGIWKIENFLKSP